MENKRMEKDMDLIIEQILREEEAKLRRFMEEWLGK